MPKQPARLANRTQWSLADIVSACSRGRDHLNAIRDRNNTLMDPLIAVHLSHLIEVISTIQVTAILAQNGEYKQEIIK